MILYQRGSMGGQLLLTGTLGYFLYLYASMALGAAYNRLFVVYSYSSRPACGPSSMPSRR